MLWTKARVWTRAERTRLDCRLRRLVLQRCPTSLYELLIHYIFKKGELCLNMAKKVVTGVALQEPKSIGHLL